ncbi:MAG: hypothetical protein SFU85_03995 [Candidatus Methylacidiphilales bacterium]|nr:hypothetical protein [Candidatus Methylacidiphilales bacterium]
METPAWIEALERRLGGWSVPHLVRGLVVLNALAFLLEMSSPGFTNVLLLDRSGLLQGEWWRALTFLFAAGGTKESLGILFFGLWMMVTWMFGEGLESAWGSFKLTLYLAIPVVLLVAVVWFLPPGYASHTILLTSLFLAFATLYPDLELMLFFILPVKCKWLAWVSAAFILLEFLGSPASRPMILASLSSYFLFFFPGWWGNLRLQWEARSRRERFRGDDE